MNVFVPVYKIEEGSTAWVVEKIDLERARYWKHFGYDATLLYKGMLYNGETAFSDDIHAWLWVHKDPEEIKGRVDLFSMPEEYFQEKRVFG